MKYILIMSFQVTLQGKLIKCKFKSLKMSGIILCQSLSGYSHGSVDCVKQLVNLKSNTYVGIEYICILIVLII